MTIASLAHVSRRLLRPDTMLAVAVVAAILARPAWAQEAHLSWRATATLPPVEIAGERYAATAIRRTEGAKDESLISITIGVRPVADYTFRCSAKEALDISRGIRALLAKSKDLPTAVRAGDQTIPVTVSQLAYSHPTGLTSRHIDDGNWQLTLDHDESFTRTLRGNDLEQLADYLARGAQLASALP